MLVGHFPDRIPRIDNGTLNHMGRQGTIDHHLLGVDAYFDLGLLIQLPYRIRNRDNTLITADPFHLKFIHGARLLKPWHLLNILSKINAWLIQKPNPMTIGEML